MKPVHCLERVEMADGILLLQGWVAVPGMADMAGAELQLRGRQPDGQPWCIPIAINRERPDVVAALKLPASAQRCGFFYYGPMPQGRALELGLSWPQGESCLHTWAQEEPRSATHERDARWRHWAYLLRRAAGLVRGGQWRALAQRARRHLGTAWSERKARLRSLPAADLRMDCLIIDHDLGGGANQYRRNWASQAMERGENVALLTFSVVSLRYVVYHLQPGGTQQVMRSMTWSQVLPWLEQARPAHIFFNNAVSFPHALALAQGLAAYKTRQPKTCYLSFAVHDYFAVCPSQHLMNAAGQYCDLPSPQVCESCMARSQQAMLPLYRHHGLPAWRQAWGSLLLVADKVLVFDESAQRILQRAHPQIADSLQWELRPHTVPALPATDISRLQQWKSLKTGRSGRIGVVGAIESDVKGISRVHALVEAIASSGKPYQVVAIGQLSPKPIDRSRFVETGPYAAKDLTRLIIENDIDVFFFASIGPETFSYVLHELERYQLPIAAFDLGAQSTFLDRYPWGVRLDLADDAQTILAKIEPHLQKP